MEVHQSGITIGGSGGVRSRFARRGYPQPAVAEGHALSAAIANSVDSANTEAALRESGVAGPQVGRRDVLWWVVLGTLLFIKLADHAGHASSLVLCTTGAVPALHDCMMALCTACCLCSA